MRVYFSWIFLELLFIPLGSKDNLLFSGTYGESLLSPWILSDRSSEMNIKPYGHECVVWSRPIVEIERNLCVQIEYIIITKDD